MSPSSMFPGVLLNSAHALDNLARQLDRDVRMWAARDETRVEIDIHCYLSFSEWCARCEATDALTTNTCSVAR